MDTRGLNRVAATYWTEQSGDGLVPADIWIPSSVSVTYVYISQPTEQGGGDQVLCLRPNVMYTYADRPSSVVVPNCIQIFTVVPSKFCGSDYPHVINTVYTVHTVHRYTRCCWI